MTLRAALVLSLCLPLARESAAGEAFPYIAYVRDTAAHRSGPGVDYYPTGKLTPGTAVEVYRHELGGWCAIRPPEGSFSWVRVADLKPVDGNIASVTNDRASARVGSLLVDERDVEQVRLEWGEEVEVLENLEDDASAGSPGWLRIAPPAGEFRWVALSDLTPEPPVETAESASSLKTQASSLTPESAPATGPAEPSITLQLASIDLALAGIVSQPPEAWSFDEVWAEAEATLDRARTASEAGRVRAVMKRITRFEDIQRRHAALAEPPNDSRPPSPQAATDERPGTAPTQVTLDTRYDGMGTLARVASQKLGEPQFALLDEAGTVREYVTAAPGVNLSRYVGRQVGINGLRGYLPESGARHVTAQRVIALDRRLLR